MKINILKQKKITIKHNGNIGTSSDIQELATI